MGIELHRPNHRTVHVQEVAGGKVKRTLATVRALDTDEPTISLHAVLPISRVRNLLDRVTAPPATHPPVDESGEGSNEGSV